MPVLKAKIGGVWVPLGSGGSGSDEVAIGPSIPTDPGIELWYDTDDPQGQAGGVPAAGAIGQVLTKLGNEDYNVGWVGPKEYLKMPLGYLAQHSLATAFVTTGTHTTYQDEGLTVTMTELASRILRISLFMNIYASGGVNGINVNLLRNGVQVRQWGIPGEATGAGVSHAMVFQHVIVGSAGGVGVVYKTQLRGLANTAVNSYGSATEPRVLLVEDLGGV